MVIFEGENDGFTHYADLCAADYPPGVPQFEDGKAFGLLTNMWAHHPVFFKAFEAWKERLIREATQKEPKDCYGWVTVLDAHGAIREDKVWCYEDCKPDRTRTLVPMQEWVDANDGKTMVLVLHSCNPKNRGTIQSKRSLVIHARSILTSHGFHSRQVRLAMHIPGYGYITSRDQKQLRGFLRTCKAA